MRRIENFIKEEEASSTSLLLKPTIVRLNNSINEVKRGLRKRLHADSELDKALREWASKRPRHDNNDVEDVFM